MKFQTVIRLSTIAIALTIAILQTSPARADGPDGTPANEFATNCQEFLGPLRSQIAQGDFAGFGPFGEHFTGQVNPGFHVGTVGEEAFLDSLGIDTSCNP